MVAQLGISHNGGKAHMINDQDCLECLDTQIDFLQAIRKAGGITKFRKNIKKWLKTEKKQKSH